MISQHGGINANICLFVPLILLHEKTVGMGSEGNLLLLSIKATCSGRGKQA